MGLQIFIFIFIFELMLLFSCLSQHYFVKYTATNCNVEDVNGLYIEHDFHRIPEQFQDLQNRLENDLIHMWRKHTGNHFRVWFQNSKGYTLYHDALDMKWHIVDNNWDSIFTHKDVHHHDDGEQAGSHETELPPLDGYVCDPSYSGKCDSPPIFTRKDNRIAPSIYTLHADL